MAKKQIRKLKAGDILPSALSSGPVKVTGIEIEVPASNGGTAFAQYRIRCVWIDNGQPLAGLVGLGKTEVEVL